MTRTRTLLAVLVALLAGALLVAPAAQAKPVARTLSVKATPATALAGGKVTLAGKLSHSPKNSNVKVQRKVGKRWVTVKTVHTTTAAGAYKAIVTVSRTAAVYRYRTWAPGFEGLKAAFSQAINVTALRKTTFTKVGGFDVLYQGGVLEGQQTSAIGHLDRPFTPGAAVALQRQVDGAWSGIATATVDGNGLFQISFTAANGTYRVVVGRKGLNAAATSAARTVTFGKA